MAETLRIAMVVGEASGDILGSGLMAAILKQHPDAEFYGVGGPRMIALGFNSLYEQERLAVMGLIEPLKRLPELLRMRKALVARFIADRPAAVIGIDSPDFNLSIEEQVRAAGIASVHYVSPSVWAWRQKRIHKIARAVDLMLTLLPFEAEFYRQHQVPVCFVGHPLADDFPMVNDQAAARVALGIAPDAEVITLMPGSRGGEVALLGDLFLQTAEHCLNERPNLQFLLPAANSARRAQIDAQLAEHPKLPLTVVDGNSHQLMQAADAVLMASGTTTLEALLLKRPMVVAYKMAALSYAIISRLLKSKYISLPNLLADRALVPEFLQKQATPEALSAALLEYFEHPEKAEALQQEYSNIHTQLRCSASERAADAVLNLIAERR